MKKFLANADLGRLARTARLLALGAVTLAIAGCGSSALDPSSLLPKLPGATGAVTPPPAVKPVTATDRTVYVAGISAKAKKCGYNFDSPKLKANYLAAEVSRGTPADELAKLDKVYDVFERKVSASISDAGSYCSSSANETIKRELSGALAGQFDPPKVVNYDAVLADYTRPPDEKFDYNTAIGGAEARDNKKAGGEAPSSDD